MELKDIGPNTPLLAGSSSANANASSVQGKSPQPQRSGIQEQGGRVGTSNDAARQNDPPNQPQRQRVGFKKKMCVKFFPSRKNLEEYSRIYHLDQSHARENIKCRCGLAYKDHEKNEVNGPEPLEDVKDLLEGKISVQDFTNIVFEHETDRLKKAYNRQIKDTVIEVEGAEQGEIEFWMDADQKSVSEFARLSDKTKTDSLKAFLNGDWKLMDPKPELVISLTGSTQNKELVDKLVKGIIKLSKFVDLLILTSGLESDLVAKKIGDAVSREQKWTTERKGDQEARERIKCVGITTWGGLKDGEKPELKRGDKYCIEKNQRSPGHFFVLNPGHKYFLLVDTGTRWNISRELNKFWINLLKQLKGESPSILNLVLGTNRDISYTTDMIDNLLADFSVVLLRHSSYLMDRLIEGVKQFHEEVFIDYDRVKKNISEKTAEIMEKFLKNHLNEAHQQKNVMVVCDIRDEENSLVRNNLVSALLKTLSQPILVTATVNETPGKKDVLKVVELAAKLRCWEVTMDDLFFYKYEWDIEEKKRLDGVLKECLLHDCPEFFRVLSRWVKVDEFLTVGMLAELYSKAVVNDPIQVVFKRKRLRIENIDNNVKLLLLNELIRNLKLPTCYLPEVINNSIQMKNPYKELLIWSVLSKKWHVVGHILYNQKSENILVWFLATAYLCRTLAYRQRDMEIRQEFKEKQRLYETNGKRMLEILSVQHGGDIHVTHEEKTTNYMNLSLQEASECWGGLNPADFALLGNFKTFVRSEAFHNFVLQKWKSVSEDKLCPQPRVKFYTHWVFYMVMVMVFCSALISRVQYHHFAHQIWLLVWIFSYIVGEVFTRRQTQKKIEFSRWRDHLLFIWIRKYVHLLLLSCFLIGGLVCTLVGSAHWGAMLYGFACLILILIISGHFLTSFRLFAPQISILKKAFREIFSFLILIILLVWSVGMVFHGVLCLDDKIVNYSTNETTVARSWTNMFHSVWFLYLSLYGEYSFELNQQDDSHLCIPDRSAMMWVSYILIGLHILIGNVLFMNLMVSVLGTKADALKTDLVYQWKSNWYKQGLHYEKQTALPPPFNLFELLARWICYCRQNKGGQNEDQTDAQIHESKTSENLQKFEEEAARYLADEARQKTTRL